MRCRKWRSHFANAIEYVRATLARGATRIDEFAPQLSFFFVAQMDFFRRDCEIPRGAPLWASTVKENWRAKGPVDDAALSYTDRGRVPDRTAAREQYRAHGDRSAGGGTGWDAILHTNSYHEALALPTEQSAKIALRTQQIIGYESGVTNTVDPVGRQFLHRAFDRRDSSNRVKISRSKSKNSAGHSAR